jgi:hypothetical protein
MKICSGISSAAAISEVRKARAVPGVVVPLSICQALTPAYPYRPFADISQAREWVQQFSTWHNAKPTTNGPNRQAPPERWKHRKTCAGNQASQVWLTSPKTRNSRWKNQP